MESDEGLYHATPQTRGKIAHETIDKKKASNRTDDLQAKKNTSHIFSNSYNTQQFQGVSFFT